MNRPATFFLLILVMVFAGCGKDPLTDPTGNWTATLSATQPGSQTTSLGFNVKLATNANQATTAGYTQSTVTATSLNFTTSGGCLSNTASVVAGFSSDPNSNVFAMTITGAGSSGSANNVLQMQGTLGTETIEGTWALNPSTPPTSGTSTCIAGGTFTMKLVSGTPLKKGM